MTTLLGAPLLVSALALSAPFVVGCGDPLVGRWVTHAYPGGTLPTDVSSYEEDLTFGSDMSLSVSIVLEVPKTAPVYPGCAETCALSSLTWVVSNDDDKTTLTVSGAARKTASRSGCASSKDDAPAQAATPTDCPPGMPGGAYTYTISNGKLTTTDVHGGVATYTLSGS